MEYYKTIYDCPIWNYFKTIETGDSRYLYRIYNEKNKPLDKVFDDIFWQYQEETGLDNNFKMAIEYRAKIAELRLKELETGKNQEAFIARYETYLDELKPKGNKQSLSTKLAILRKWYGQPIPLSTTLFEYIGIEKLYIEHAKTTVNK